MIKVLIADDQALIRESLQIILSAHADIEVVGTVVFKIFSQMAQSNFAISVAEENVEDMSQTEWKIIQQIGFGVSNKEIAAKLFLSEGTVRNYLSGILTKLNLRDRTQLAIWAVQTGVTQRDFSKDNDK